MAYLFDDAASDRITAESAADATIPFSFSAWFRTNDVTITQTIMCIGASANARELQAMTVAGTVAGDPLRAVSVANPAGSAAASSVAAVQVDTWMHGGATFVSATDRRCYLNGVEATDTTSITVANLDRTAIGITYRSAFAEPFSGDICEVGIWSDQLSAAQFAELAKGYSPLLVKPSSLIWYRPLVRTSQDLVGNLAETVTGTTVSNHYMGIKMPSRRRIFVPAAAAADPEGSLLGGKLLRGGLLRHGVLLRAA